MVDSRLPEFRNATEYVRRLLNEVAQLREASMEGADSDTNSVTNLSLLSDYEIVGLNYLISGLGWMPGDKVLLEGIRSLSAQMYEEIKIRKIEDLVAKYDFGK